MSNHKSARKLHRTLPLSQALAIGIGTMVGAGIFVFPGIAISYATRDVDFPGREPPTASNRTRGCRRGCFRW